MDDEFLLLERETRELHAKVEELLAYFRANKTKVQDYLSRLQTDPCPDLELE
jgi:hypothetical protein